MLLAVCVPSAEQFNMLKYARGKLVLFIYLFMCEHGNKTTEGMDVFASISRRENWPSISQFMILSLSSCQNMASTFMVHCTLFLLYIYICIYLFIYILHRLHYKTTNT